MSSQSSGSEARATSPQAVSASPAGQTVVQIAKRDDGTFQATQKGIDVYGYGDSAARATEDMARQIAEAQESGGL